MKTQDVIGRSRTGDQLHACSWLDYQQEGRPAFISNNAHCNQRMKLRPLSSFKGEKVSFKLRPGLFCKKCFGEDAARIVAREYFNAIVTN